MRKTFLLMVTVVAFATTATAGEFLRSADPVEGQYIVVLKDEAAAGAYDADSALPAVSELADEFVGKSGGEIVAVWNAALKGFSVRMDEEQAKELAQDPRVEWVEQDGYAYANVTQSPATWGIDRTDQRNLPLSNSYTYVRNGAGTHSYIIDTGILASHTQFTGRIGNGYDAIGGGTNDCNGHGTHVAGTVGGTTYGIAKGTILHPVRVLNCQGSGTWTQVINGVNWVRTSHIKPAVANMSLGGSFNSSLNSAVSNAIAAGVSFSIAAGNSNANACNYSPASVASAVTVGSTTSTDARSSFSNWGTCLDIFAPGSSITSAYYTCTTCTAVLSGTSMAAPHVAGAIARYLQSNPAASPATVTSWLTTNATLSKVTSPGTGSPNRLLYVAPTF